MELIPTSMDLGSLVDQILLLLVIYNQQQESQELCSHLSVQSQSAGGRTCTWHVHFKSKQKWNIHHWKISKKQCIDFLLFQRLKANCLRQKVSDNTSMYICLKILKACSVAGQARPLAVSAETRHPHTSICNTGSPILLSTVFCSLSLFFKQGKNQLMRPYKD